MFNSSTGARFLLGKQSGEQTASQKSNSRYTGLNVYFESDTSSKKYTRFGNLKLIRLKQKIEYRVFKKHNWSGPEGFRQRFENMEVLFSIHKGPNVVL